MVVVESTGSLSPTRATRILGHTRRRSPAPRRSGPSSRSLFNAKFAVGDDDVDERPFSPASGCDRFLPFRNWELFRTTGAA